MLFCDLTLIPTLAHAFVPAAGAQSCKAIKDSNPSANNGRYKITPIRGGNSYQVYCEMQLFGGGWTLVTLIKNDKIDQWKPDAVNPEDLAKFTKSPSRVSKLSDAEINVLLGKGGTRWVTAGSKMTFYRMTDKPWNSNHGYTYSSKKKGKKSTNCKYKRDFYDAWAEPAAKPVWQTAIIYIGCGGIYDGKEWGAVSGGHISGSTLIGGFDGKAWNQNGFVLVRSHGLCELGGHLYLFAYREDVVHTGISAFV